jgi:hypothetical protein
MEVEMTGLPGGTVTLLFTDIEGSTRLIQRLGEEEYGQSLGEYPLPQTVVVASDDTATLRTSIHPSSTYRQSHAPRPRWRRCGRALHCRCAEGALRLPYGRV